MCTAAVASWEALAQERDGEKERSESLDLALADVTLQHQAAQQEMTRQVRLAPHMPPQLESSAALSLLFFSCAFPALRLARLRLLGQLGSLCVLCAERSRANDG